MNPVSPVASPPLAEAVYALKTLLKLVAQKPLAKIETAIFEAVQKTAKRLEAGLKGGC